MSSLDERIERIEKLLSKLVEKLDALEQRLKILGFYSEEFEVASELVSALSIPIVLALESASRVLSILSASELEPISRDILKTLSTCEKLSISEITRRVRVIRGRASRRIIRDKLVKLESSNLVVNIGSANRPLYVLKKCIEK